MPSFGRTDLWRKGRDLKLFRKFDERIAAELATQRKPILIGLLCTAAGAGLTAAGTYMIKFVSSVIENLSALAKQQNDALLLPHNQVQIDSIARQQALGMRGVMEASLLVLCLFGARYWFVRGQTYYLSEAANRLTMDLRTRMLDKLLRLPISYFNDRRSGSIQSVLTNDVNVYQNAVGIIRDSVEGPVKAVGAFVIIVGLQWKLSLIAFLLIPVMVFVIQRNARRMRKAQTEVQQDLAEVSALTLETLQGNRIIKAFGAEQRVMASYSDLITRTFHSQMAAVRITAALRPLVEFIGAFAIALLIYICGLLAERNLLGLGDVLAIVYAMDTINQGFRSLGGVSNTYATVQAASARIYSEILEVPEGHEFEGGSIVDSPNGRIEFKNVSFAYPDGTQALKDVSFTIDPGTSLALVGTSGAGKSTIADLALRFYDPSKGQILFDGVDISELDVKWLRSQIGVVPQQTFLFAGSIEDNVRMGNPGASTEDLREALQLAHAEDFVNEMKDRPTSELGERGIRLSGGQMQRVAIARALVRKPTVLLLDEATSALDATSEKAVTEALDEVMKTRTTLFIAHRLTTAARADRILVLSRGQVVEVGSHSELIESNGAYAALFRAFSGGILA